MSCLICKEEKEDAIVLSNCTCKSHFCVPCLRDWYKNVNVDYTCTYCQQTLDPQELLDKNIINIRNIENLFKKDMVKKIVKLPSFLYTNGKPNNMIDFSIFFQKPDIFNILHLYDFECSDTSSDLACIWGDLEVYKILFFSKHYKESNKTLAIRFDKVDILNFLHIMMKPFTSQDLITAYNFNNIQCIKFFHSIGIRLNQTELDFMQLERKYNTLSYMMNFYSSKDQETQTTEPNNTMIVKQNGEIYYIDFDNKKIY